MPYLYPSDVLTEYSTGITAAPDPRLSVIILFGVARRVQAAAARERQDLWKGGGT